jgi:hypothetical protein
MNSISKYYFYFLVKVSVESPFYSIIYDIRDT